MKIRRGRIPFVAIAGVLDYDVHREVAQRLKIPH